MISQLQNEVVQGPEERAFFGKSLLVRPTIETSRVGRFPTQAVVVTSAARRLIELAKEGERINAVLVVGENSDPTDHPEFKQISEQLRELVNKHFPKAKLSLVSEAPRSQVRHSLCFYDQTVVQLSAGYQKTFAALTGADPKAFKEILEHVGRLDTDRLIVEANFVRGEVDNSKDSEVNAWIRHLAEIKPAGVRISTPAKASGKTEKPITKTRMTQIAELVTSKTGIPVEMLAG